MVKEVATLGDIATVQSKWGRTDEALANYQRALNLVQTMDSSDLEEKIRVNIASIHAQRSDYQTAISHYLELLSRFEARGDYFGAASIRFNLSLVYMAIGDPVRAEFHFDEAKKYLDEIENEERAAELQLGMALLYTQVGDVQWANDYLQQAQEIIDERGNSVEISRMLHLLAVSAMAKGEFEVARGYINEALDLSQRAEAESDSARLTVMRDLLNYAIDDDSVALQKTQQGIEQLLQAGDLLNAAALHALLAIVHMTKDEFTAAYDQIRQAIDLIERQRTALIASELKRAFSGQMINVYDLAVILAFINDQPEEAFHYAELSRARTFLEQLNHQRLAIGSDDVIELGDIELIEAEQSLRLTLANLQKSLRSERNKSYDQQRPILINSLEREMEALHNDYTELLVRLESANREYAAIVKSDVLTIEEIQHQLLDERTTLILYFIPEDEIIDHVVAWVIDKENVHVQELEIQSDELKKQVQQFRDGLQKHGEYPQVGSTLYDHLIAPLKPYILHQNLIIAPHGILHYVPFAALWNTDEERYLAAEQTISYIPSASVLQFIQEKRTVGAQRMLVMGNPDGSLPGAEAEAKMIAELFNVAPFIQRQAVETHVHRQAGQFDILHLAAHGVYNQFNPFFTRIELAADKEHDGNLEVHEVYRLNLDETDLVVLSACETGVDNLSNGDEIVGLSRAFIYAGAPSVITSLWSVDDEATAFLITAFYRHLLAGATTAEALQKAQLEAVDSDEWRSPYYWAAFNLTGDYIGADR